MTIIKFSTKVLLKLLIKTSKFSTVSLAEGDRGFSDISVESLRFRYTSGAKSWGTLKDSRSKNKKNQDSKKICK